MAKEEKYVLTPEGIFNPLLRFAFTNITEETLTSAWDGSPIVIPAGETVELPHHLAVKLTKELVDKIMIGNAKLDELAKDQPYYRSPQGGSLGVPAARKVWEDQIVRQLEEDEESPQTQIMRARIKEELLADLSREPAASGPVIPTSLGEFADLGQSDNAQPEKAPIKLKKASK